MFTDFCQEFVLGNTGKFLYIEVKFFIHTFNRQQAKIVRVPRPTRPEKARRLGYKSKQGYVIYRVRVRRGNRKKPLHKGKVSGKPTNHGIKHLKPKRNLQVQAEAKVGKRCPNLRVLNSYWVNQVCCE